VKLEQIYCNFYSWSGKPIQEKDKFLSLSLSRMNVMNLLFLSFYCWIFLKQNTVVTTNSPSFCICFFKIFCFKIPLKTMKTIIEMCLCTMCRESKGETWWIYRAFLNFYRLFALPLCWRHLQHNASYLLVSLMYLIISLVRFLSLSFKCTHTHKQVWARTQIGFSW